MRVRARFALALTGIVALAVAGGAPLSATNGMYLVGYGAEVVGRGGANLAISDRALALNFNPAGISQLQGRHYSFNLSLLAPSLEFENMVNESMDSADRYFPLPAVAYVRSGRETPWAWGVGFVAQGGMGATFEEVNTFFGTVDETFTEVRFATLSPTVSYAFSEATSLGLTLNIGYADASFRLFPETSFFNTAMPAMSFFGLDMDKAGGAQYNARIGWLWSPSERFSVGAIYQTETQADFDGGDMVVNFSAHPFLGQKVGYTAEMEGFTFAAQAGVGIAFRPSDRTIVALDVKRYFWDDAIDTIVVRATEPDVAGAPPEVVIPFVFDWQDQWVLALGADFRATDRLTLRAGYNYGENPVPAETLNSLFPATTEHHLTVGLGWLAGNKVYDVAIERAFANDETNPNPDPMVNPFGPGARVSHEQWTVSFGVTWALARKRGEEEL